MASLLYIDGPRASTNRLLGGWCVFYCIETQRHSLFSDTGFFDPTTELTRPGTQSQEHLILRNVLLLQGP
ncbi:MAG: hypothetical protein CL920_01415 [Deltaproteobacteria bacterium]|nr:hypothetical protein [Deltaproteobacteria bacterium]MBU47340.1 hypothetical protein [Deltaproteobacteria bacterium]